MPFPETVELLAIFPHPDDAELGCGGTLEKAAAAGHRVGIVDLARGEMASRGTVELRAQEAQRAAKVLGVSVRENVGLPDAGLRNDPPTREQVALVIRRFRPRVVIAPALDGRHPDHRVAAQLVRDACFVAGLAKIAPDVAKHRPLKILHSLTHRQDYVRPTFVVDVSAEFELKLQAIRCYESQFEGLSQAGEVYPNGEPLEDIIRHHGAYYGALIRRRYGEPFLTTEMMAVDDIMALEVSTL
jgi:bacillithiol biosynthesis deacetylase BshB1